VSLGHEGVLRGFLDPLAFAGSASGKPVGEHIGDGFGAGSEQGGGGDRGLGGDLVAGHPDSDDEGDPVGVDAGGGGCLSLERAQGLEDGQERVDLLGNQFG